MVNASDLRQYAEYIATSQNMQAMVETVEKELLHYEILDALDAGGFLDGLVFQGGTSLRLCYGAERYSEDLDFSGGRDFDRKSFDGMVECIRDAIGKRYGVTASVRTPKDKPGMISAWTVIVDTTPDRRDIASQRIKIEVASIEAHDVTVRPLSVNYDRLPASYGDVMVRVETRDEILADKVQAFVCSDHMRFRDIWDMAWLARQSGVSLDKARMLRPFKDEDYGETELYSEKFPKVGEKLSEAFASGRFAVEMRRFLPADRVARTVGRAVWLDGVRLQLEGLLSVFAPGRD